MTPELRDLLQRELSDLKNRKVISKRTDSQLLHQEILSNWRNSEENKIKNRETAMKSTARFTMDEVKEMRDKYYYGEPITQETLNEMFGNKVAPANIKQILTNVSYKIDDWNYPDFEERKKQYKIVRDEKYAEDVLSGIGITNFMEKWGLTNAVYYRICKKIGYEPKRNGSRRPNV
jgi:hypothetical protein